MAILGLILGFLWDKSFKYSELLDFIFGVFAAIGFSMIIKILPLKMKE